MDDALGIFIIAVLLAVGALAGAAAHKGAAVSDADVLKTCQEKKLVVVTGVPYRCAFEEIKE